MSRKMLYFPREHGGNVMVQWYNDSCEMLWRLWELMSVLHPPTCTFKPGCLKMTLGFRLTHLSGFEGEDSAEGQENWWSGGELQWDGGLSHWGAQRRRWGCWNWRRQPPPRERASQGKGTAGRGAMLWPQAQTGIGYASPKDSHPRLSCHF